MRRISSVESPNRGFRSDNINFDIKLRGRERSSRFIREATVVDHMSTERAQGRAAGWGGPILAAAHEFWDGTSRHNRNRFLWGIPGTLLTLSVVGAPVGLPMVWKAYEHRKAHERAVVR